MRLFGAKVARSTGHIVQPNSMCRAPTSHMMLAHVSCWTPTVKDGIRCQPLYLGSMVDKLSVMPVPLCLFRSFLFSITPPIVHIPCLVFKCFKNLLSFAYLSLLQLLCWYVISATWAAAFSLLMPPCSDDGQYCTRGPCSSYISSSILWDSSSSNISYSSIKHVILKISFQL